MTKKEVIHELFGDHPLIGLIKKGIEYGAIIAAVWAFGLPAFREEMTNSIEKYHSHLDKIEDEKISFRVLLGQEMGIPSDRVHIVIGEIKQNVDAALDSINQFNAHWVPYLEEEQSTIRPGLLIINGREYWLADDNELYRVVRTDGYGHYFKDGEWKPIFNNKN